MDPIINKYHVRTWICDQLFELSKYSFIWWFIAHLVSSDWSEIGVHYTREVWDTDNIITNNSVSGRRHLSGILYTDISDHLPVFCFDTCSEYTRKEEFHRKRMINRNSLNRLMAELNAINWSFIYENETEAQLGYTDFINIFQKVYDKCIPIRYVKRKVNPSKPWLTEGLMKCIKVKNKLYKERVKSPSPLRIEIYKRYRNKLNNILIVTEKKYYETLF